jgi:hypothetical protein
VSIFFCTFAAQNKNNYGKAIYYLSCGDDVGGMRESEAVDGGGISASHSKKLTVPGKQIQTDETGCIFIPVR